MSSMTLPSPAQILFEECDGSECSVEESRLAYNNLRNEDVPVDRFRRIVKACFPLSKTFTREGRQFFSGIKLRK